MCAQPYFAKQKRFFSTPMLYLLMIILGLISGFYEIEPLKSIGLLIADVFIKLFKCISLPIIALSIIVTLAGYRSDGGFKNIWKRTMCYTLLTTLIAAALSFILYLLISPEMVVHKVDVAAAPLHAISYTQHIASLIPDSFFAPFLEHQVMSVLLIAIILGSAIRFIPEDEPRYTVVQFFRGIHGLMMVITKWVIALIPLGLYGFITASVVQLQHGKVIKGIGEYLAVIVLANLLQGIIILPLWLKTQGIPPFKAMKEMMPALSLAFFSKSSVGSLPVTMETIEKTLAVNPKVSRFVLPLCTSINMNGCAAFIFVTVIYLMQNHGIVLSLPTMTLWIVISTVAAIGNAGVPMGCFFLSASLLSSMNVPITLMGIILPFYTLIDMLETSLNVWSDVCVTAVVDKQITWEENISSQ